MKTFLQFLFVLVLTASGGYAIPTLTQSNSAPSIGETITVYNTDTTVQDGAAGPSQTWTYSNLTFSTPTTSDCINPSGTPSGTFYPTANIALSSGGGYQYLNSSPSSLLQLGAAAGGQVQIYDQGVNYLTYPFTYNSVATTSNFTGTHVQGTLQGSSVTTGDAYGTLIINGQTFPDVLRILNIQDLDVDYTGIGHLIYHTVSYSWYDGIHKTPLLQINTSEYTGISIGYYKVVSVADFITETPEIKSPVSLVNLFPNPTNDNSNISFSLVKSSDVLLKIYNDLGEQIFIKDLGRLSPGFISEEMDLSAYAKGIYTIDLIADGRSNTRRLVVD